MESKVKTKSEVKNETPKLQEALKMESKVKTKSEVKNETPKLQEALKAEAKFVTLDKIPTKESPTIQESVKIKQETPKLQEVFRVERSNPLPVDQKITKLDVAVEAVTKTPNALETKMELKTTRESITTELHNPKEIKAQEVQKLETTPLFKVQTPVSEQVVQSLASTKVFKPNEKAPKIKVEETFTSLLQVKPTSQEKSSLTADFVVDTARVIAPTVSSELSKGLESLLFLEGSESTTNSKLDGLNMYKSDSLEVKLNEAKQMIKYLSSDVKTAIEDYKSPFTRVKLQLNPQRLGEIDLTVVQRGKNLHINLSSNSTAINTLSMNVNELRVQLNNSGINNASLNFNNNSQDSQQSFSGGNQQKSQQDKEAKQEYTFFDNEERQEEILSSLEIVVPNYA